MKLTRLLLIAALLILGYCFVVLAAMYPWLLIAAVVVLIAANAKKGYTHLWANGTARFADQADLQKTGMLDADTGLILGRLTPTPTGIIKATIALFNRRVKSEVACEQFIMSLRRFGKRKPEGPLVRLPNAVHTAVFAPTGAGKGVSLIIPFLLTCEDSCVVVDLKEGELAKITADARRKMGHRIVLLDPFKKVTDTPDTLNPLADIDKNSPFAIDDCRETGAAIVDRKEEKGDGVHFLDNAEGAIAAISALLVQFGEGENKSLQAVCDVVSNPQKWLKAVELMCGSDAFDGMLARLGGNLTHLKERELASSMTTIARFMRFLSTPAIAASTRSSSFKPSDLCTQKLTVYLILPPDRASALSQLLRLWIGSLIRGVVRGGLQEKTKVHFICDEANLLGKMDQISNALTVGRGFGLRMQLYYQDCGQLKKCWPDGQDQTLMANCTQVFFRVNDLATSEYVSNRCGEETIVVDSGGANTGGSVSYDREGGGNAGRSWGNSNNWAQQARKLLKPEEVTALPERVAITFTPGVPPLWTTLVRYYEQQKPGWFKRLYYKLEIMAAAVAMLALCIGLAWVVTQFTKHPQGMLNGSAYQQGNGR